MDFEINKLLKYCKGSELKDAYMNSHELILEFSDVVVVVTGGYCNDIGGINLYRRELKLIED